MSVYDLAVIGLGAMGSATVRDAARRGLRVIGFEQFEPGHDRGSSHGESRAIRLSYHEHPSYVPLVRSAYEAWAALERDSGERLLTLTGILEAGVPGAELVRGSRQASEEHGIEHDMLGGAEIRRRFPAFDVPDHWEGLYQRQGGFLRPEAAIHAFVREAARHGATMRSGTKVLGIEPGPAAVVVRTEGGTIEAGAVVVAAGAWIGAFAPDLAPHLRLTRQVLGWFAPKAPDLVKPGAFPVFILENERDCVYGFPDFAGTGVKAASHDVGRRLVSADDTAQDGGAADEAQIRALLSPMIPAADGRLLKMRTCIYTHTPDGDFVVDRSPADPRVILASPCSGHGFKFAAIMGEVLTDLATAGTTPHDIARFRLDRFARA